MTTSESTIKSNLFSALRRQFMNFAYTFTPCTSYRLSWDRAFHTLTGQLNLLASADVISTDQYLVLMDLAHSAADNYAERFKLVYPDLAGA